MFCTIRLKNFESVINIVVEPGRALMDANRLCVDGKIIGPSISGAAPTLAN